ncbi:MAG: homoserine O-acetyltransferase [Gluconobacter potus]|uniref:Homoserine O-acetyltransferase n=1 Tax=Gluconobacter potus TaxID=2724927 RepID=A0ABR9YMD0_9PROT|nr:MULTISPECIES: homoserine O-acetyltransferase [Gluconobacter]MBF0864362.1 homoserine O-acetyltransferase [Gluconobacter sp. R71656]MBF0867244.1 homoserine O-acetyltransferase [Gluconobacter sp. R75628]MBF0873674.1 homoserine O-acetyltransferase [Gluconobacter sp. R75629]MBF0882920.1 homoserine O-acetyltransferase [Gluconobacter potus]
MDISASPSIADGPVYTHQTVRLDSGLDLECGVHLAPLEVAYCTYGTLSPARDNAILVCHALTGDQYLAERNPLTGKPGWWSRMVGPGLPIDTDRYFVVCSNVLGGCMGTTGPRSICAETGKAWDSEFPPITMHDIVAAQAKLIDHLGIDRLFAVIGGSMGGMQALTWAADFPDRVFAAMPIATSPFHSAQNIAFNEVSRQAIFADPDWHDGHYRDFGAIPARGLGVARMMAHITYLSEEALSRKFGRRVRHDAATAVPASSSPSLFGEMFEVESYLRHQGSSFVRRFDANSYLTITRAMDYFDLAAEHDGDLANPFRKSQTRFCVVSFSSDWLFPTSQSRLLVRALNRAGANVSFVEIESDRGHDAFLLEEPDFDRTIRGFITGAAEHAALKAGER